MEQIVECRACETANRVKTQNPQKIAICGNCGYPLQEDLEVVALREENFDRLIKNAKKPVLVDFWAQWCNPCQMFLPILKKFKQLHPEIIVTKVDVDSAEKLAENFSIQTVPTLIIFENGKVRRRVSGVLNLSQLESFVQG